MTAAIVGREAELAAVVELLDVRVQSGPAGLALWGEAGIGKSTVWRAGVDEARERGYDVLMSRPAAGEVRLSYGGLTDLLANVSEAVFDALPAPQRRALNAALLIDDADEHGPDQRAVAAAFLSVLNRSAPVLLAIDDVQWLDGPTRRAVGYAMRRCRGPVALLTTERAIVSPGAQDWLDTPDPTRLLKIRVGALSVGALHQVLLNATGRSISRPTMVRITALSDGNPFYAIEIARLLPEVAARAVSLPTGIGQLVGDRLAALDDSVRRALLVASAAAEPRVDIIEQVCGTAEVAQVLSAAEDAGLVEMSSGVVRFTHPLWANAVYHDAPPSRRRAVHRQLGRVVTNPEERARHQALATTQLDAEVLAALDAAADHARRRGAASAAAELAELAIARGADDVSRRIRAARDHFNADDHRRARELLTSAIAELGPGCRRAEALCLLGTIVYESETLLRSVEMLEQAFAEAGDDEPLRCQIAMELAFAMAHSGSVAAATRHVTFAVAAAERIGDAGLLAEALAASVVLRVLQGDAVDRDVLQRALTLEDPDRPSHALLWPSLNAAVLMVWRHDVVPARRAFQALAERCIERGAESDLWVILSHAAQLALWAGDVTSADALVAELAERARMVASETGQALATGLCGIVRAWCGDVEAARGALVEGLASLAPSRFAVPALHVLAALGKLELSLGNHAAAAGHLAPAVQQLVAIGMTDPEVVPFGPDAAEALIALGRIDEAETVVAQLEHVGVDPDRAWPRAVGARCRGLILAAQGDLEGAAASYARAIEAHAQLPEVRVELARTLLVFGQLQRRRGERYAASSTLEQAARLFDEVGSAQWAINARAELDRIGLRHGRPDQLTPSEAHIAMLAADGLTNRAIAAAVFVSAKTVEAHLGRVYRKLGVRNRAELVRRLDEDVRSGESLGT